MRNENLCLIASFLWSGNQKRVPSGRNVRGHACEHACACACMHAYHRHRKVVRGLGEGEGRKINKKTPTKVDLILQTITYEDVNCYANISISFHIVNNLIYAENWNGCKHLDFIITIKCCFNYIEKWHSILKTCCGNN